MKSISKALVGTVAAGAMALTATVPAQAQRQAPPPQQRDRDRGSIDAGDIIAGALIIGGIAAVASAANRNNDRYDRDDRNYSRGDDPRDAVERCVNAAERGASRVSYRGSSKVTDIRKIDRKRNGYTVKGRIAVNTNNRAWRQGDARYGRGWNGDLRGWNDNYRGYDAGSFTCKVEYGRVVDLDFSGIRGLR